MGEPVEREVEARTLAVRPAWPKAGDRADDERRVQTAEASYAREVEDADAVEQHDSITRSTRTRSAFGTSYPMALAVRRFSTASNRAGRSTGMSGGRSPGGASRASRRVAC